MFTDIGMNIAECSDFISLKRIIWMHLYIIYKFSFTTMFNTDSQIKCKQHNFITTTVLVSFDDPVCSWRFHCQWTVTPVIALLLRRVRNVSLSCCSRCCKCIRYSKIYLILSVHCSIQSKLLIQINSKNHRSNCNNQKLN